MSRSIGKSMDAWQKIVAEIRAWDRREHNWHEEQKKCGSMPTKNLKSKSDFIHSMQKKYKLLKK